MCIRDRNSDESGIEESYFHLADEKAGNRLLYKIISSLTPDKSAPSYGADPVSYTHLDVYKRQVSQCPVNPNISTPHTSSTAYPFLIKYRRSLASVSGPQDT